VATTRVLHRFFVLTAFTCSAFTVTRESTHQARGPRPIEEKMERVEHRRPSASDRQHTAGQVHQTALRLYFKKLSVLTTRLRTGHSWSSTYTKAFRFRHNDLCIWREREIAHRVLLDGLRLGGLMKELRSKVGDAFNSISILLKGPGEERRGKIDSTSRTKTVDAVLDFAEVSQRFQSRAP
jgi:hypothetical protein